jgi:plasmid stabilization system protein ParE
MSLISLWTPEAEAALRGIQHYLRSEWGAQVAAAFESDVFQTVAILEAFPECGILEVPEKGIRSIPIVRQVRMFYRVTDEHIIILELIDTRSERFQQRQGAK